MRSLDRVFTLNAEFTRRFLRGALAAFLVFILAGCSTSPVPLTDSEVSARVQRDRSLLAAQPMPGPGPYTLQALQARALAQNLDLRIAALDALVARGELDLADLARLPQLTFTAGYTTRDPPGNASDRIPSDRKRSTENLELAFNILDFGISYLRARQSANQALIADERRTRLAHTVLNDVREHYWIVALGSARENERARMRGLLERGIDGATRLVKLRLLDPLVALSYHEGLVELRRQMSDLDSELSVSRARLARLVNAPAAEELSVDLLAPRPQLLDVEGLESRSLEDLALLDRPELREADLNVRNRRLDIDAAYWQLLPSIRLRVAQMYDSSTAIAISRWDENGSLSIVPILGYLAAFERISLAERSVSREEVRRLGLALATIEQVRVAREQYARARADLVLAREGAELRTPVAAVRRMRVPFAETDELERDRAEVEAFVSAWREARAFAAAQRAESDLYASIGVSILPDSTPETEDALARELASRQAGREARLRARLKEIGGKFPVEETRAGGGS